MKILSDMEYNRIVKEDPFPTLEKNLQNFIKKACEQVVIAKEEFQFIHIPFSNKPFFYHLPKIHEDLKTPPGRPIISGINGATSNLSHYIDLYLQNYVVKLDSNLKDSYHLIKELLNQPWERGLGFLTMDVTSLYSNIQHEIGINCVRKFLDEDPEIPESQKIFLLDGIRFILENNFFIYNHTTYQQQRGTAMGTRMAPSYANLFMGAIEEKHIWGDHRWKKNTLSYIDNSLLIYFSYGGVMKNLP